MKKIVINISETTYEKFRFESIMEKKDLNEVITDRIFFKPFHQDVEKAFESFMDQEIDRLIKEN